ncbi:MAG: hypothetical protein JXR76_20280 [Deltaproteobacteria bacterium]|nr:hypothetical protein [Deltaproteobacteria bacterium]
MYGISVSAPGKLFLSGEYAVLEGAEAVISSVGRRVTATTVRDNIPQSKLLKDVRDAVAQFLYYRTGANAGQLPNIEIDSRGFSVGNHKLGIGSSAAVSASATGALFEWAGLTINDHRDTICQVATDAHRTYQNGSGSGADVATSVYGGTIIFSHNQPVIQSTVSQIRKVFIWTGKSASTVSLMEEVRALKLRQPEVYASEMGRLVTLAHQLAHEFCCGGAPKLIALTRQYGDALLALGTAAHIDIVTEQMKSIATVATACDGASKPSGAGGGDAVVALFENSADANRFVSIMHQQNLEVLDFDTHVAGLRREDV